MKILSRIFFALSISLLFCSCNDQQVEPDATIHVTFVNNSSHTISVTFDGIASWCKIENFTIIPNDKVTFSYDGHAIGIFKATVTYDNKISIIHEIGEASISEGLRNICCHESHWWEKTYDNNVGNKAYYTYIFNDEDYSFAVNMNR